MTRPTLHPVKPASLQRIEALSRRFSNADLAIALVFHGKQQPSRHLYRRIHQGIAARQMHDATEPLRLLDGIKAIIAEVEADFVAHACSELRISGLQLSTGGAA